jgi:hypothetical protein
MKRQSLLGLLAGTVAAGLAAAPTFADDQRPAAAKAAEKLAGKAGAQAEKKTENLLAALAKRRAAEGTIESIDAGKKSLVIANNQGKLTVTTDDKTKVHLAGKENAAFGDLKVGQRVLAQGERPNDTTLAAARIAVLPTKEQIEEQRKKRKEEAEKRRAARTVTTGTLSNVSIASDGKGSFTITPQGGSAVNVVTGADTVYTFKGIASGLANGQRATVVSVKNDAGQNVARQVHVPARG